MALLKPDRHELYSQARAAGKTQAEAYLDAGYRARGSNASTRAAACKLDTNINIINRVSELKGRMASKVVLTRHYILEAAIENAEKALGRRPVKVSRRKKSDNGEYVDETAEVYLYEGQVANAALKMLGSELNMFVDRKDVRIVNEYDKLSDDELAEELKRAAQLLLESNMKVIEHDDT